MARMTLKHVHVAGVGRRAPLRERVVDENLGSYRHLRQPREQLTLAQPTQVPRGSIARAYCGPSRWRCWSCSSA